MENRAASCFLSFLLGRERKASTCFPQKMNNLTTIVKLKAVCHPFQPAFYNTSIKKKKESEVPLQIISNKEDCNVLTANELDCPLRRTGTEQNSPGAKIRQKVNQRLAQDGLLATA